MTHPSKRKGNGFERELVNQAVASGIDAKRAYASNGESLGMHAEVDLVVAGQKIQAKRRKKVPVIFRPSDQVDATAIREDHGETFVLIRWFDYLDLIKAAQSAVDGALD